MIWKLPMFSIHTTYENIIIDLRLTSGQPKQIVDSINYKQLISKWLNFSKHMSTFKAFLNPHHWLHKLSPNIVKVHLGVNLSYKLRVERKENEMTFNVTTSSNYSVGSSSSWSNFICDPKMDFSKGTSETTAIFQGFGHLKHGWTSLSLPKTSPGLPHGWLKITSPLKYYFS